MHSSLLITDVLLTPTKSARDPGLVGFVECTAGGELRLFGLTLRKTSNGADAISFPARRDKLGVRHPYMRPIDQAARRDIERQILGALRREGKLR